MYGKASWNIILQPVLDAYVYIFRMFRLKDWSWLEIKATTPLFGQACYTYISLMLK